MHEHGIADEVFKALLEEARRRGASRITAATVHLGEFSGITADALVHSLEHCCEHESMPAFPVTVVVVGPAGRCLECGHEAPIEKMEKCTECESDHIETQPAVGVTVKSAEFA